MASCNECGQLLPAIDAEVCPSCGHRIAESHPQAERGAQPDDERGAHDLLAAVISDYQPRHEQPSPAAPNQAGSRTAEDDDIGDVVPLADKKKPRFRRKRR